MTTSVVTPVPPIPTPSRPEGVCAILSCTTPHEDTQPVYYSGDVGTVPLVLCRSHREFFPEYQLVCVR